MQTESENRFLNDSRSFGMAIALLLFFFAQYASAETIKGFVRDGDNNQPVAGATVEVLGLKRKVSADQNGFFIIKDVGTGELSLRITSVGYYPGKAKVSVASNQDNRFTIILRPRAIEISPVVVTSGYLRTKLEEVHEHVNTLKGQELQRELGQTLAATLKNETGIAMRSMGPAPARPVIRGQGGDRVTISEDGNNISDLSATSPDHAVTIEPFSVKRIEVIRGPGVLAQSSNTFGGVVNIVRNNIPSDDYRVITGTIGTYGESANKGYAGYAETVIPLDGFNFRLDIARKETSDLNTPLGNLDNSASNELDYNLGAAVLPDWGHVGFSYRSFDLEYEVPGGFVGAHPFGVFIDMSKRQYNLKGQLGIDKGYLRNLDLHLTRVFYRHTEYENEGTIGSEFKILNYNGFAHLNLGNKESYNKGILGFSFEYRDLELGGFVFQPPSVSQKLAPYYIQSLSFERISLEFGGRFEYYKVNPDYEKPDAAIGHIRSRSFGVFSASFSMLYEFNEQLNLGINVSRSARVPTIEELYSEGPHLAAYSYEIGNPDLEAESGYGGEVFLYHNSTRLYFLMTGYYNSFSNFIIHRNSGEINWNTILPVYTTEGVPSRMYGFESQFKINITDWLSLNGSISYTRGEFRNSGDPLPQIPPLKSTFGLEYISSMTKTGLTLSVVDKQTRIDEFEEPTDGYAILNAFSQITIPRNNLIHSFSINIDNIFNKEYRNHLSRVKSILPEAGSNLRIAYKLNYEL